MTNNRTGDLRVSQTQTQYVYDRALHTINSGVSENRFPSFLECFTKVLLLKLSL